MLGDEQPLGDLIGCEVLVEQQQNLELPRGDRLCDRIGNARVRGALADLLEEATCRNSTIRSGDSVLSK